MFSKIRNPPLLCTHLLWRFKNLPAIPIQPHRILYSRDRIRPKFSSLLRVPFLLIGLYETDRYQWRYYGHIPHFCRINGMISSFKFLNNNFPLSRGIAPIRGHALGFYLGKILFVVPFLNSTVSCSCYPDDVERVRSYMYDII